MQMIQGLRRIEARLARDRPTGRASSLVKLLAAKLLARLSRLLCLCLAPAKLFALR